MKETAAAVQIYCINMASETKRREHIQSEFAPLGLTPTFIDAVDGKGLGEDEMRRLVSPSARAVLTPGEIGCSLSHLKAYERIVKENLDRALIIEDDIRLTAAFPAFLEAADALPAGRPDILLVTAVKSCRMGRGRDLAGMTVYPIVSANGSYAYALTRTAAANLLAGLRPVRTVTDDWKHFMLCGLVRVWAAREMAVLHDDGFESSMERERTAVFFTPERQKHFRRIQRKRSLSCAARHFLWKKFVRPFEEIS